MNVRSDRNVPSKTHALKMDAPTPEVLFAQKLAANEKKTRDRALKKLRRYIQSRSSSKSGFDEEDLVKLWKGLHYCMWMQDKPVLQEELALQISRLVFSFSTPQAAILFFKVFLVTEAREWNGIDRLRLDKFFMLVRQMLNQVFVLLKQGGWSEEGIEMFTDSVKETLLDTKSEKVPDSLSMHLADIYLIELAKVGSQQLNQQQVLFFLKVFDKYLQVSDRPLVLKRICVSIYDEIAKKVSENTQKKEEVKEEGKVEEKNEDVDDENEDSDSGYDEDSEPRLKFDAKLIADHLFTVGGKEGIRSKNRQRIYKIISQLRDSLLPVDKHTEESSDDLDDDAVENLLKQKSRKRKKSKKKGERTEMEEDKKHGEKAGKHRLSGDATNSEGPSVTKKLKTDTTSAESDSHLTKKKKKKKKKRKNKSGNENTDNITPLKTKAEEVIHPDSSKKIKEKKLKKKSVGSGEVSQIKGDNSVQSSDEKNNRGNTSIGKSDSSDKDDKETTKVNSKKAKLKRKKKAEDESPNTKKLKKEATESPKLKDLQQSGQKKREEPLAEGEVEIWVPNRKYQKKVKDSGKKMKKAGESPFAKFDKISTPPPAFVKRAVNKVAKTPVKKVGISATSTPELTNSEKKVKFNMKKNTSQKFEDSIHVSPLPAFSPYKTPTQGILKSPGEITPITPKSRSAKKKHKKLTPSITRSRASDFFS